MKQLSVIATNASRAILPQLPSQPKEMLLASPLENERTARSLLQECGLQLKYTLAGGALTPTSVTLVPTPQTNWQQCGLVIAGLMAPAPEESLVQWLSTMSVLMAKKDQAEQVSELEVIAYAQKLREWPGDVVRVVLSRYPDEHKWWPEWFDLRNALKAEAASRLMLAETFRKWIQAPEFMARRSGLSEPEALARALPAPVRQQEVPKAPEIVPEPMTAEERDARMKAMKAAILKGGDA